MDLQERLGSITFVGCCNSLNVALLSPHDVGGLCAKVLKRVSGEGLRILIRGHGSGINLSLRNVPLGIGTVIFLDDFHMLIGRSKLTSILDYGRGHNAVRMLPNSMAKDGHIVLVGTRIPGDERNPMDLVCEPFAREFRHSISVYCVGLVRGLLIAWPNRSMFLQLAREFYLEFLIT